MYREDAFVISEAGWCWLSPIHEKERLWGHYIWIFLSEFDTIVLYAVMFFYLRRRIKQAEIKLQTHNYNRSPREAQALKRINRVVIYMVIYPLSYVILSLPLAAGRMSSARHLIPSRAYFAVAGSLMALSGVVDAVVYTLTRRQLLLHTEVGSNGRVTGTSVGRIYAYTQDHTFETHVSAAGRDSAEEGGDRGDGDRGRKGKTKANGKGWAGRRMLRRGMQSLSESIRDGRNGSTEGIVKSGKDRDERERNLEMKDMDSQVSGSIGGVYQETTFEIRHEEVDREHQPSGWYNRG
ncbi:uncharacterized protein BDV17DRAFT_296766 [Aspergillus undulatus]|uniref:uncharacterized protein n=1 Tax=Aspergillus undulatus TaxID=1810928 RepID=UPI003CCDE8EA